MNWIAFLSLLATIACAQPVAAAERSFSVLDFERIEVVGNFVVSVTTGRATTVKARGTANGMDRVALENSNGTLIIRAVTIAYNGGAKPDTSPVSILITVPRLSGARLQGSGSLGIADLKGQQAELVSTGSGTLSVARIAVDRLSVRQSGASQVVLAGKALSADLVAKGSGGIEASGLLVSDLKLVASNSGAVRGKASRTAAVTSTGTGLVEITGKIACTVQNTGAGEVHCGD
jgi:Putative auto-transporter adhesin, head GIN domain